MKNKFWYAADNSYSTPSSVGFSNTWIVRAFDSGKERDYFLRENDGLAAKEIKYRDIPRYVEGPKPFSGDFRAVMEEQSTTSDEKVMWVDLARGYPDQLLVERLSNCK